MSASTAVAQAFVDAWHGKHADGTLGTLDVWDGSLHEFDGAALHAKYAALSGDDPTPEHEAPQSACPRAARVSEVHGHDEERSNASQRLNDPDLVATRRPSQSGFTISQSTSATACARAAGTAGEPEMTSPR